MKILSIDTSSIICAVGILENDKLIKEIKIDNGLTHSEKLMPIIKQILDETNLNLKDIDLLVCDIGPGSFTGIRIGIATVKAFTDSLKIPLVGISSLEALAYNIKEEGLICSLIDAKNENVYFSLYRLKNGNYDLVQNYLADSIDNILDILKKYNEKITFIGDGTIVNKEKIQNTIQNSNFSTLNDLNSYSLGLAGLNSYKNNSIQNVLPLYLRKPQAERMLEEKNNGN